MGITTDSLNTPLQNVNILAFPQQESARVQFSISNQEGQYKLSLKKNIPYRLEVSYLGYKKYVDTLTLTQDTQKNITLQRSNLTLEEIIVTERTPVKVRGDTITYRPEKFVTGEERKARDVLKKLPGVEVDRAGNVKVNGKEVTKLLVDGKAFFTGDEKLGVNNIPAEVIDEVEVLDNYTEVAFLKGLSDSEQMALNIKLKAGKKKFAFGELSAGAGIEDRYTANPTLFYYSPKTSVNAIGDFNNVGIKSFTTQDYVNFEGGFARMADDPAAFFKLYNDDFAQYLSESDFIFNRNNFGALSINQKLSQHLDASAYSIISRGTLNRREAVVNAYITQSTLDERRTTTANSDAGFSISKLNLHYAGKNDLDVQYDLYVKTNDGERLQQITSDTETENTFVNERSDLITTDITQKLAYNKRFSQKHTTSITASHKYLDNDEQTAWRFNEPVFINTIPLITTGDEVILNSAVSNQLHNVKVNAIHYWVLHKYHHIYPEAGVNWVYQNFDTQDSNGNQEEVAFENAGFNNQTLFNLRDYYAGLFYKVKIGKLVVKPSFFLHQYSWKVKQQGSTLKDEIKAVGLPALDINWELTSAEKIKFNYGLNSTFANGEQLSNRLRLSRFNTLSQGNENLENELFHKFRVSYSKFSLFKGIILNTGASYTRRVRSIRNTTVIAGINQVNQLIFTSLPEDRFAVNASLTKLYNNFRLTFNSLYGVSAYSRIINDIQQDYTNVNWSAGLFAKSRFKNAPNLEAGISYAQNSFEGGGMVNDFYTIAPTLLVEARFLKDFVFTSDYTLTFFNNVTQNTSNTFQTADATFRYQRESSPWGFEVNAANVFDIDFRRENSFSQFLVSDRRVFLQPRTILVKASYSF